MPNTASDSPSGLRLVIVGHVDHGKSTLIGRLLLDSDSLPDDVAARVRTMADQPTKLASVADHLAEERQQERTVDVTQVFFNAGGRRFVIIDTPGHAEFLKNMFTGASRADAAVLIVDSAESVREQTVAHARLLALLGVRQVVALVNKMDASGYRQERFDVVATAIRRTLQDTGLTPRAIVPAAAMTGENIIARSPQMAWYAGPTLLETLSQMTGPTPPAGRPLRFAVQGACELDGRLLAIGRVESGRVRAGAPVRVLPDGADDVIEAVRFFNSNRTDAEAGECPGVLLRHASAPQRGWTLADPVHPPGLDRRIDARLFWMADQPLVCGEPVELRIATQAVTVRAEHITDIVHPSRPGDAQADGMLPYGHLACVRLVCDGGPIAYDTFAEETGCGRLVLSRSGNVVGAGIVPGLPDAQSPSLPSERCAGNSPSGPGNC